MPKIKILHIIKSLGRGGAEMLLPETLTLHNKDKFEFHYIYFLPWKNQMVSAIEQAGGQVKCFPAKNNLQLLKQYKKIARYCVDNNIQLIHAHLPWAGFLARLVHQKTGIPVIYTEHNMQERYHPVTKYLNKFTYNWQSLALAVSGDVKKSIQKNIHPRIPVKVLLNGVNTGKFNPENFTGKNIRKELNIPDDAIVIGNVAVFRFQKRLVEWLQILKKLTDKYPNVYGILVGDGILKPEIEKVYNELQLQKKVILTGLQTDVKPYFNAMDIFMMSSSFEGLPIALLEAMSMKCAVVSTDAGGIKELIRNGKDGLLCSVQQWEQLTSLASKLIENPEHLLQYQLAARKRVINDFSLQAMVEQLEKYYQNFAEI
jgi:glycosyltransferase involved in cell wall biosynthesis